jgi:hypothetical protein
MDSQYQKAVTIILKGETQIKGKRIKQSVKQGQNSKFLSMLPQEFVVASVSHLTQIFPKPRYILLNF